jgi:Tfp pilus assembly protein PilV
MFNKFRKNKIFIKGSTLIELIIAVMVVGLIVTAIASAVTYSIKNTSEAKFRQAAATLGQEAIEFIRSERARIGHYSLKNNLPPGSYCFNNIPNNLGSIPPSGACGTNYFNYAGHSFKRDVVVSNPDGEDKIRVVVTVVWRDGGSERKVELIQEFRLPSN